MLQLFKDLKFYISFILLLFSGLLTAQQVADTTLVPEIEFPKFEKDNGPVVYIDELHNNFHTMSGRFLPFSKLIENDGYQPRSLTSYDNLDDNDVLVISNAIHQDNLRNWRQPIEAAFTDSEIEKLKNWVFSGGRLLLIADHMPFSGAANSLASAFGFHFCDGFAQLDNVEGQPDAFSLENNRLLQSEITNGNYGNKLESITTFTGSSFTIPESAIGLLKFKKGDACLQPEVAWRFNDSTKTLDLEESYQGSILYYGKGKLAVFGEAAMFTAQSVTNGSDVFLVGFNSPDAPNNVQFIRNLMYWLSITTNEN